MAQSQEPRTGDKRGASKPARSATPATKRLRTSSVATPPTHDSPVAASPVADTIPLEKRPARLPSKLVDSKPLPTLPEPQLLDLSNDEYQTIAASAVLAASLDRSRTRWIHDGLLQRYWVKPETGKNAKPPPPNNPDVKWMKPKGECRIRLEPHVFTADVFVEERPPPPKPKSFAQGPAAYAQQQYRPPPYQNRPLQPGTPQTPQSGTPLLQQQQQQSEARARAAPSPVSALSQDKKASPDPVISMLASRASSNPELKTLMKEVATGNATPDQLKVFQKHIDELTAIISKQKQDEGEQAANAPLQSDLIQYDGAAKQAQAQLQRSGTPQQPQPYTTPVSQMPVYQQPQAPWTPPTHLPVIVDFKDAGASEDRFLIPQLSILESLSPQHELVSFMIVKKGREAVDASGLEPEKEYWQPITMMVEVAYGREEILNCIRRWIKPADEVRKHMEGVMQRCVRAPETHLALRLPFKGSAQTDSEEVSKEATPIVEEKAKPKPAIKNVKRVAQSGTSTPVHATPSVAKGVASATATPKTAIAPAADTPASEGGAADSKVGTSSTDVDASTAEPGEGSRPRRAVRKSVRISEG